MRRYVIVIEQAEHYHSGYVPDLPVCIATGDTPEEVEERLRDGISLYLETLREEGLPVPEPSSAVVDARVVKVA